MICGDNMTEVTLEFANERLERLTDALRFGMATVYATQEQIDAEIAQLDLTPIQGQVSPYTAPSALMFNFAASVAIWASASIFVWFYKEFQPFLALFKNKSGNR